MTVNNFLKNKEKYSLSQAAEIIIDEALGRNTLESIKSFEINYEKILQDYTSNPSLYMSSVSFELNKLPSFKIWLTDLKEPNIMQKYMPFIVAKMFEGDPLAHSIFVEIYKELGKDDLLFSSTTFDKHPELKYGLSHSDAGVGTKAIINAEHWVNSKEGKELLCNEAIYKNEIELLIGETCD